MKRYTHPEPTLWPELAVRPALDKTALSDLVQSILNDVKQNKDQAIYTYAEKFDKVKLTSLQATAQKSHTQHPN